MATSKSQYQATLTEKLDLIPGLVSVLLNTAYIAVTAPFRGESGGDTYKNHLVHGLLRHFLTRFNTAQLQYIGGSFSSVYEAWCKKKGVTPDIITLPSGIKAFWIGDKSAKNIAIYYHGGGFSIDGSADHLNVCESLIKDSESAGKSIAFLFLEYTLVPYATYPTQLREGVEIVQYVLNDLGKSPSDVLLSGDSAGGNMALAVLLHISHPSPDLPKLEVSQPFKGAVLLAPWVSFRTDFNSAETNRYKDILWREHISMWSNDYLAGKPTSPYAEALLAPADWWKGLKVEQVLVCAGSDEILADPIDEWVKKYKSVNPETTTYVIGKNEIHDAPLIESQFSSQDTEQGKAIKSWLKAKL